MIVTIDISKELAAPLARVRKIVAGAINQAEWGALPDIDDVMARIEDAFSTNLDDVTASVEALYDPPRETDTADFDKLLAMTEPTVCAADFKVDLPASDAALPHVADGVGASAAPTEGGSAAAGGQPKREQETREAQS